MVRLNSECNKWKQLSSLMSLFIGLFTTLLAAAFASSQTATTAGQAGSGSERSAQEQSSSGSGPDSDTEIIQELERMRNRIQELESELKQRHTANSAVADAGKSVSAKAQQLVSGSGASPQPAVQTEPTAAETKSEKAEPFAFADWTWLNGNPRTKEPAFDSKFFTPEVRSDAAYHYDFNHPQDDTISGSSEVFRSNEIALTHFGVGGDFHYDHVRARIFSQLGQYATATPRNDASYSRGQWQLDNAYRYLNEAYGGHHSGVLPGSEENRGSRHHGNPGQVLTLSAGVTALRPRSNEP